MSSHKKRKGSAAQPHAHSNGATRPAGTVRGATATTSAPIARTGASANGTSTATKPAVQTQNTATAKRTATPAAARTATATGTNASAVVRRGAANTRKRPMTRYAREQRRQRITVSTIAIVLVVGALAWILATHWPFHGATTAGTKGQQGITCATVAGTGINTSTAPAGGPAHITGTVVNANKQCLQYVDSKVGTGAAVKAGDTVTVNYTGWLTNGTKFDSSLNPGRTPFQVVNVGQAQVIPGWNEGLIGMKVGGTRRLVIPGALGYGAAGSPPTIPPNATLVFDVSVVSIP
ncbi:MAG TPA: FKBP-type peptidyl-prolyl cis-trans isomerase [Ktedonobacterales bacterium]|jgi:peptidylprolyl isomerase